MGGQTCNRVIGDEDGDVVRWMRPFGPEPMGGPVQRPEECARRHGRVGGAQRALLDAVGDDRPNPALVSIALGDDRRTQPRRQGVHFEVRRRSFDFVEEAEDVRDRHVVQALGERAGAIAPRLGQRLEQAIERSVLAEEENLVLAAEVMVEIGGREIGGDGDLAHPGGGKTAGAEDARGGAHDVDAPAVGADRTPVRKLNHRSILAIFGGRSTPGRLLPLPGAIDAPARSLWSL
jgi:hypothetical protein